MTRQTLLALLVLAGSARAESFQSWAARASREEREKNDAAALESYSNALSSWKPSDGKPAKARALCARAELRERRGDAAGSLADLSDCLALDKKNAKALDRRGRLYFKDGRTALAIDDFYRAIADDIGFGQAYADRGKAYERQGDREFAAEDFRHACELGVKPACAKAKELSSARRKPKAGPSSPRSAPAAAPDDESEDASAFAAPSRPAPAPAPAATPAPEPAPEASPAPPPTTPPAPKPARAPRRRPFADCLASMQACADADDSYGTCVDKATACEKKSVNGCCPAKCLKSFHYAVDGGMSEAAAFREIFIPGAACAGPQSSNKQ